MNRYLCTLILALLAACGGGDPEPEQCPEREHAEHHDKRAPEPPCGLEAR